MNKLPEKPATGIVDLRTYSPEELQVHLNSKPARVQTNPYAQNSLYVPIDEIETSLDAVFGELGWKITGTKIDHLGNIEQNGKPKIIVLATVTLSVLHPILRIWIDRDGVASGSASLGQIETFGPKLKAEAMKNAAKSLGRKFGRGLNRQHTADTPHISEAKKDTLAGVKDDLAALHTFEEVSAYYRQSPYKSEKWFVELITKRRKEVQDA